MRKKIIQIPIDPKLLSELDTLSKKQGKARAEVIREACAHYVADVEEAELVRQYVESYKNMPETQEEHDVGEAIDKMAAQVLAEEPW